MHSRVEYKTVTNVSGNADLDAAILADMDHTSGASVPRWAAETGLLDKSDYLYLNDQMHQKLKKEDDFKRAEEEELQNFRMSSIKHLQAENHSLAFALKEKKDIDVLSTVPVIKVKKRRLDEKETKQRVTVLVGVVSDSSSSTASTSSKLGVHPNQQREAGTQDSNATALAVSKAAIQGSKQSSQDNRGPASGTANKLHLLLGAYDDDDDAETDGKSG